MDRKSQQFTRGLCSRNQEARTKEALDRATSELLPQLTPENAEAWFRLRLDTLSVPARSGNLHAIWLLKAYRPTTRGYQFKMRRTIQLLRPEPRPTPGCLLSSSHEVEAGVLS